MRPAEQRRAARAARGVASRVEERLDLGDPGVDPDDLGGPLRKQVVAEAAAAVHLDEEAAEIAQHILARPQEGSALAPEQACMGPPRSDALVDPAPAKERGHPGESNEGGLRTRLGSPAAGLESAEDEEDRDDDEDEPDHEPGTGERERRDQPDDEQCDSDPEDSGHEPIFTVSYNCKTTSRSSVISRTVHAGPSFVFPEAFTPP
jgi:hypothetical protein